MKNHFTKCRFRTSLEVDNFHIDILTPITMITGTSDMTWVLGAWIMCGAHLKLATKVSIHSYIITDEYPDVGPPTVHSLANKSYF